MQEEFNDKAQKVVNWDEWSAKRFKLQDEQFTWKDQIYEGLVDTPMRVALWVWRGMTEAVQQFKGTFKQEGNYYYDILNKNDAAPGYFDRDLLESDVKYQLSHGLNKKFQEKAAAIARQAFEESKDYSVLVKTGQFRTLEQLP